MTDRLKQYKKNPLYISKDDYDHLSVLDQAGVRAAVRLGYMRMPKHQIKPRKKAEIKREGSEEVKA